MKKITKLTWSVFLATICFIVLSSAFNPPSNSNTNSKQLIGEWRNVYLKILINHPNGSSETLEADSSTWEAKLNIHPIRTHFEKNGGYYSEYINLKDSIIRRPSGTWALTGDSLILNELTPHNSTYRFLLHIDGDRATFNGNIDFDGDGNDNDVYYGIQKKFK